MKVKPIGERILLKPKQTEEKTSGGIYIPDSAKEKTNQGTIVAVGDVKEMPVEVGDVVMYESYAGSDINVDNEKHIILAVKDIIAKIE